MLCEAAHPSKETSSTHLTGLVAELCFLVSFNIISETNTFPLLFLSDSSYVVPYATLKGCWYFGPEEKYESFHALKRQLNKNICMHAISSSLTFKGVSSSPAPSFTRK